MVFCDSNDGVAVGVLKHDFALETCRHTVCSRLATFTTFSRLCSLTLDSGGGGSVGVLKHDFDPPPARDPIQFIDVVGVSDEAIWARGGIGRQGIKKKKGGQYDFCVIDPMHV